MATSNSYPDNSYGLRPPLLPSPNVDAVVASLCRDLVSSSSCGLALGQTNVTHAKYLSVAQLANCPAGLAWLTGSVSDFLFCPLSSAINWPLFALSVLSWRDELSPALAWSALWLTLTT